MTNLAIDRTLTAAILAVVLGSVAGVLSAQFPADLHPWMPPIVAGITAIAAIVRRQFSVPD